VFIKHDFAVFNSVNDTGIMSCRNKCLLEINYGHTCINRSILRKKLLDFVPLMLHHFVAMQTTSDN